jgi:hypothetical protein
MENANSIAPAPAATGCWSITGMAVTEPLVSDSETEVSLTFTRQPVAAVAHVESTALPATAELRHLLDEATARLSPLLGPIAAAWARVQEISAPTVPE